MKALKEILLIKDATINKVQFDKVWYFNFEDIKFYLQEDLNGVESVLLPIIINGEKHFVKYCSFDDLRRGREGYKI